MIRFIFTTKNNKVENITAARIHEFMKGSNFIWMDIQQPTADDLNFLEKNLKFHEVALEDCMHATHSAKIDEYKNHLFIITHSFSYIDHKLRIAQLNIFLGKNFLVSIHHKEIPSIELTADRYNRNPILFERGPDFLLYNLLDYMIDHYFDSLDVIDDIIDKLEIEIFRKPSQRVVKKLFRLKRDVLHVKKIVVPERELFILLTRDELPMIRRENHNYFREVYDHIVHVSDAIDVSRDLISTLLDSYSSMISNKLNEIMKVLTIIATIMMPLTLITGIYGMNFKFMPEIHTTWGAMYGYYFALALMFAIGIIMIFYFRKLKWI